MNCELSVVKLLSTGGLEELFSNSFDVKHKHRLAAAHHIGDRRRQSAFQIALKNDQQIHSSANLYQKVGKLATTKNDPPALHTG